MIHHGRISVKKNHQLNKSNGKKTTNVPVGGFNPVEKYLSNWIIPQVGVKIKNIWNYHLDMSFFSSEGYLTLEILPWWSWLEIQNSNMQQITPWKLKQPMFSGNVSVGWWFPNLYHGNMVGNQNHRFTMSIHQKNGWLKFQVPHQWCFSGH